MSNPGRLKVDRAIVETDAAQIASASSYFCGNTLGSIDGKSTIAGNATSKNAFNLGQMGIVSLGQAIDAEVVNIRSLGLQFEEFDMLMNRLNRRNESGEQ